MIKIEKIYIGSWFQRTTLHLSEVYDFLKFADSPLKLDKNKLRTLKERLEVETVEDILDDLEYVYSKSSKGIEFKIFEDGLIIIGKNPTDNINVDIDIIKEYYENKLSPCLSYLFSLGAPIPKELANIKTVFPYFLVLDNAAEADILDLLESFKQPLHTKIKRETFEIFRGNELYIINSKNEKLSSIEHFVGEQVFMREFKGQLHHYLNLHRIIWENIEEIKDRKKVKGKEIGALKEKVEAYEKSINLIGTRINQMGVYSSTRANIIKSIPEMEKFIDVLRYRHETLNDSLSYVREIWGMTRNYVSSALAVFSDLQNQATNRSLQNLTVVTSVGVGATLLGLFARDSLPKITWAGVIYFLVLALIGYLINKLIKHFYLNRSYTISEIKEDKDIK